MRFTRTALAIAIGVAFPYSQTYAEDGEATLGEMVVTATKTAKVASEAPALSVASFWDVGQQKWVGGQKSSKGIWPANVATQRILATSGFFLKEVGTVTTWTNAKPYTWP